VNTQGPPGFAHVPYLPAPRSSDEVLARAPHPVGEFVLHRARAFAEALFSTDEGPPPPARIAWLMEDLRDFLGRAGGNARMILQGCLLACDLIAPLFIRRAARLTDLSVPERIAALERVEHSALGPIALGPKAILCMLWFEHPDTQRETDTAPSCLHSARVSPARADLASRAGEVER
jgi:hypothetical protein